MLARLSLALSRARAVSLVAQPRLVAKPLGVSLQQSPCWSTCQVRGYVRSRNIARAMSKAEWREVDPAPRQRFANRNAKPLLLVCHRDATRDRRETEPGERGERPSAC
jgi:hypothetical protein